MFRVRSVILIAVGMLVAAGCGESQSTQFTTARPPTTSTTVTTVASTTTTVDPLREFQDLAAPSAREVDALRQEAVRINEQWDSRTTDYATTHDRLEELVGDVEEFSLRAAALPVPDSVASRWGKDETLQGLTEASREMLVGLEMPDDGSHRREALATFGSLAESYVKATGVYIPPTTTTTVWSAPPSVSISCPLPSEQSWGQAYQATFGYTVREGSSEIVEWSMDYGDGHGYESRTEADAERELFWHKYTSPGTYVASATVTDSEGRTSTDDCTVEFSWAEEQSECHPSYTGRCVPRNVSDVDCRGGSGDGPYYVGRVTVVGPDVYRLDGDRDGIGCESSW